MARQKIRIVVEMHGGTIQSVQTDSDVELDVVFTESSKYGSEVEEEFKVEAGPLAGEIIYTNYAETKVNKKDLDPVFKAAEKRILETK